MFGSQCSQHSLLCGSLARVSLPFLNYLIKLQLLLARWLSWSLLSIFTTCRSDLCSKPQLTGHHLLHADDLCVNQCWFPQRTSCFLLPSDLASGCRSQLQVSCSSRSEGHRVTAKESSTAFVVKPLAGKTCPSSLDDAKDPRMFSRFANFVISCLLEFIQRQTKAVQVKAASGTKSRW